MSGSTDLLRFFEVYAHRFYKIMSAKSQFLGLHAKLEYGHLISENVAYHSQCFLLLREGKKCKFNFDAFKLQLIPTCN